MWDLDGDRALGLDGFDSAFYKGGWEVIGDDICYAALHYQNIGNF